MSRLVSEVDETNAALDEVRQGLEREVELRKDGERENAELKKLFEEEVSQWREKEKEWELEREQLRENRYFLIFMKSQK